MNEFCEFVAGGFAVEELETVAWVEEEKELSIGVDIVRGIGLLENTKIKEARDF